MRLIFAANMLSMIGSGMTSAGVTWYVLQRTHSETALGTLLMLLDAARGLAILWVAVQAYRGQAALWEVYLMAVIVAAGFWMFWPTVTALIQELTPEAQFVHSNSF